MLLAETIRGCRDRAGRQDIICHDTTPLSSTECKSAGLSKFDLFGYQILLDREMRQPYVSSPTVRSRFAKERASSTSRISLRLLVSSRASIRSYVAGGSCGSDNNTSSISSELVHISKASSWHYAQRNLFNYELKTGAQDVVCLATILTCPQPSKSEPRELSFDNVIPFFHVI